MELNPQLIVTTKERIKYMSTCPQLPGNAPLGYLYLIKLDSVDKDYPYDRISLGIAGRGDDRPLQSQPEDARVLLGPISQL